jgi:Cys-rich protein (TIGR01571 family)
MENAQWEPDENQWNAGLGSEYCLNCCTCCFGTCFPMCALATVKSQFDGSDLCFNCICFSWNVGLVRHYIRAGYGIVGQPGYSDCCLATCCTPCVITQLLNEGRSLLVLCVGDSLLKSSYVICAVAIRGPKFEPELSINDHPWTVQRQDVPVCADPCDTCCTFCCAQCEVTNTYSQLTGAVSISQLSKFHYILRNFPCLLLAAVVWLVVRR